MAYTPTIWNDGDVITKEKLNKLEAGLAAVPKGDKGDPGQKGEKGDPGAQGPKGDPGVGLKGTAAAVAALATEADLSTTVTKVNEIITQLKNRGVTS